MIGLIITLVLLGVILFFIIICMGTALIRSGQISHEEEEKEFYKNFHKRK